MRGTWVAAVSATLASTGLGLLLWLGLSIALVAHTPHMPVLRTMQLSALAIALVLLAIGVALARHERGSAHSAAPSPWRARRAWLAGVAAVAACAIGAVLLWIVSGPTRAPVLGVCGVVLAMAALGAIVADGQWRLAGTGLPERQQALALSIRFLSAMYGGLVLMFALMAGLLAVGRDGAGMFATLLVLGALLAIALLLPSHGRDHGPDALDHGDAAAGRVSRHLRAAACVLLAGTPLLALFAAPRTGDMPSWLWIVAAAGLGGLAVVHRLAQAPDHPARA